MSYGGRGGEVHGGGLIGSDSRRALPAVQLPLDAWIHASRTTTGSTCRSRRGLGCETITAQFNGGTARRHGELPALHHRAAQLPHARAVRRQAPGPQPMKLILGLTARAGIALRQRPVRSSSRRSSRWAARSMASSCAATRSSRSRRAAIVGPATDSNATRSSFGNAFFTSTAELGLRFNRIALHRSVLRRGQRYGEAREFDPTRLFRGAGIGVAIVTPLGPLGLDWAYGFDRVDRPVGRPPSGSFTSDSATFLNWSSSCVRLNAALAALALSLSLPRALGAANAAAAAAVPSGTNAGRSLYQIAGHPGGRPDAPKQRHSSRRR